MKLAELVKLTGDQSATAECAAHFLSLTVTNVYLLPDIPDAVCRKVIRIIKKHKKGIPLAYLLNGCWFYNRRFFVNKYVLVPRPDTEILVNLAEKQVQNDIKGVKDGTKDYHILDLCTGSGAVGISLGYTCKEMAVKNPNTDFTIVLCDIDRRALAVSAVNSGIHNMAVNLSQGDLFERLAMSFDLIVCNPPYIKTAEIGSADKYVLREPKIALDGGADGLEFYRRILRDAKKHLKNNGTIMLEIGAAQGHAVTEIAKSSGFDNIKVEKDIAERDRVVILK
jgi:release factor glutamine methyltransferase